MRLRDQFGIQMPMRHIDGHAAQCLRTGGPIGRHGVQQQRPRQAGRRPGRGRQRALGKRGQHRRHRGVCPQGLRFERDGSAGLALAARTRLDLDVGEAAVGKQPARDPRQGRHALAGVCRRMPASGIQPREFAQGQRGHAAAAIGGAIDHRIVHQDQRAIGRQLHVELEHPVTEAGAMADRGQRVLGRELAGAAMRPVGGIGPGSVIHLTSPFRPGP